MPDKNRIEFICSFIVPCETFADVGCDHGYCSEYVLSNNVAKKVFATDVSAPSLKKAEKRLAQYIQADVCVPVVTDGLQGVERVEQALIAGMGGREIVKILQEGFIPDRLVLQPMRDSGLLRAYLLEQKLFLKRDFTFLSDGKFYDLIVCEKGEPSTGYSVAETEFGRENIATMPESFKVFLKDKIRKKEAVLKRKLSDNWKKTVMERIDYLKGVLNGEIK